MKYFYSFIHRLTKSLFNLFYHHKVYGKQHIPFGSCIIAPNHTSFFDPPLIGISCDEEISFLARGSLFHNHVLKKLISSLNSYPIRGTPQDSNSFKLIIHLLQENKKVVIFPEGQRSNDGRILPIKPGIGMLVARCPCPIIPVYIHGTYDAWPKTRKMPKLWGKTACVFGSPIYWEDYQDLPKKKAQEEISNAIQKSLKMLQVWYLNGTIGEPP